MNTQTERGTRPMLEGQVSQPPWTERKECPDCREIKSLSYYQRDRTRRNGHQKYCRDCQNKRNKTSAARGKEQAIVFYGGKCVCCGESDMNFLTFDHINGDGARHRQIVGRAPAYRWLRRAGYPDTIQLLCYNCNCAKQFSGLDMCPHKLQ